MDIDDITMFWQDLMPYEAEAVLRKFGFDDNFIRQNRDITFEQMTKKDRKKIIAAILSDLAWSKQRGRASIVKKILDARESPAERELDELLK